MGGALDWIGLIAETILKLFPHLRIIKVTQMGLKLRRGNEIFVLDPGLHWWWPLISTLEVIITVRDTLSLEAQTFTTKDNKTVLISGMLTYSVKDIVKLLTTAPDYMNTLSDVATTAIHDVFIKYTWDEIRDGIVGGGLRKELRNAVANELNEFGIKTISIGLKDSSLARVLKIVQDT